MSARSKGRIGGMAALLMGVSIAGVLAWPGLTRAQEPPPVGHPLYAVEGALLSPHVSGFVPS